MLKVREGAEPQKGHVIIVYLIKIPEYSLKLIPLPTIIICFIVLHLGLMQEACTSLWVYKP